jgi:hypothetical protein
VLRSGRAVYQWTTDKWPDTGDYRIYAQQMDTSIYTKGLKKK